MNNEEHHRRLENMYAALPINAFYDPVLRVSEGVSEIEMDVTDKLFHASGAVHGSVYFKMLDDAAFFATNSYESEVFFLTTAFTTYLERPVSSGRLKAIGKVIYRNKSQFIAEAKLYDSKGNEVGRGNGIFVRTKIRLSDAMGYGA
jgi:uncharacterized protein (TIGR00369 family)